MQLPETTTQLFGFKIRYATFILMLMDGTDEYIVVNFAYDDGDDARDDLHFIA